MHIAIFACVHVTLGYVVRILVIINNQVLNKIKTAVRISSRKGRI